MLMAVKEETRPRTPNVTGKGREAQMDLVLSIVDVSRRIVGDEYIHRRECGDQTPDLILIVEKVPTWFVSPRATETAEHQAAKTLSAKVQVEDGRRKWRSAIVIAFDGEDARTLCC